MPDYIDGFTSSNNTTYDLVSKTGRGLVRATMDSSTSTATAFVVSATGITELYDGLTIVVKNTKVASDTNCTLKLNNTDAKRIWLSQANSYCTTHWGLNQTFIFVYDATNERWELQQGRDTDSTDISTVRPYYTHFPVGTNGIMRNSLFLQDTNGNYQSIVTTNGTGTKTYNVNTWFFIPNKIFYYNSSTDAESGTVLGNSSATYSANLIDLRYSFNGVTTSASTSSIVANKPLYLIVEKQKDNTFRISGFPVGNEIKRFVQDLSDFPSKSTFDCMANGICLVLIGYTYDSYRCDLLPVNPVFEISQTSNTIKLQALHLNSHVSSSFNGGYIEGESVISFGGHSEGYLTRTEYMGSHAEGRGIVDDTTGVMTYTYAEGIGSHAEGFCTHAEGDYSHSEGKETHAEGTMSHAEGQSTVATGDASHTEGYGNTASGLHSHAEGTTTQATKQGAHAEGLSSIASQSFAHAEGHTTTSSGLASHSEGQGTVASGLASHSEGFYTKATGQHQHVSGKFNVEDTNNKYSEIIGNGSGDDNRSNARTLDWNGNEELLGNLKFMDCDSSPDFSTYETNPVEPSIKWKEKGYGDKFEIRPYFRSTGDENFLGVLASIGGADTDPNVHRVLEIRPSGAEILYGNAPARNYKSTLIDMSKANNGVRSTQYIGSYYQDIANRAFAKITPVILSGGGSILEMYSQNFNTSGASVGSNTLQLITDKNGSKSVYTNVAGAWLSALGLFGGTISGMVNWRSNATLRVSGGTVIGLMAVSTSMYIVYMGGGSHSSMTGSAQYVGGSGNRNLQITTTHSSSYSEFKYALPSSSDNATWLFIGMVWGADNDKDNNKFY